MKYCKICGMAIFAVGAAVGALGASPKGDYQLYGKILGGNVDWRSIAQEEFQEVNLNDVEQLPGTAILTPERLGLLHSVRRKLALEIHENSGLVDSMEGIKIYLKEDPLYLKRSNVQRDPYVYECTVDRKSTYSFPDIPPGNYTLSFSVAQPGILSDQKRMNHYSYDIDVTNEKNEFNIFCWDIFIPVKGRVLDSEGKPVAQARVRAFREAICGAPSLYSESQNSWETDTDAEGYYVLTLPSYYPFDYALFQKNYSSTLPYKYIIATSAPGYETGSTPQFVPVNDELRSIGDEMANALPDGSILLDEEFIKQFILPEENLVLRCPDIRLKKAASDENLEIKEWRVKNVYSTIVFSM